MAPGKKKNMKKSPNPDRSVSIPFGAHAMIRHLAPGMEQDSTENYNAKFFARDQEKGKPLPQTDKNFFKFWPPTLFAFTSLFFETTGAYALISRNPWTPRSPNWYKAVNSSALEWRIGIYKKFSEEPKFRQLILNSIPQRNLGSREEAQKTNYAELAKVLKLEDKTPTFSVVSDPDEFKDSLKDATSIFPKILNRAWDLIEKEIDPSRLADPLDIWNGDDSLFESFWTLHAVADAACLGWGIRTVDEINLEMKSDEMKKKYDGEVDPTLAEDFISSLLASTGNLAFISNDRCRILPKRHTPQVGLSLRTGSYSLAWHRSAISVNWCTDARELWEDEATLSPKGKNTSNSTHLDNQLTILLLPWPLKILSRDFSSQQYGDRRFFRFKPREQDKAADFLVRRKLDRIIKEAKDETEHIDMVILPESAVCDSTRSEMEKILRRWNVSTYITGVRVGELPDGTPTDEENPGTLGNQLCLGYTSKENHKPRTNNGFQHVWYKKHHRWKLDSSQIKTYELGGQLAPDKDHWEDIEIREREAVFVNLRSRLTLCPIICEDLARQESLSELIRAVGPSLVISLLMDGPQRRNRWSSQYASFFGDDPGSSVLTLTSMGMVD